MSEQTTMLERVSLICARHMDVFLCGGDAVTFPVSPSTAEWADYSLREQSSARFLARAVIEALMTPTIEMDCAGMTVMDNRGNAPASGEVSAAYRAMLRSILTQSETQEKT